MSERAAKTEGEEPLIRVGKPRQPAWREKLLAIIDEAIAEKEAEDKASRSKGNPIKT